LKTLKFHSRKEIWPYANKIFYALNEAFAPLYGVSPLSDKQIEYYIKMYIPMLRLDLITVIVREADDAVVGFGISLPNLSHAMQKARGYLFPFGFIPLLHALHSKPKVIDLYLTGIIPEYQGKGVNALLFNDLIPVYIKLGVEYAESNPELEDNNAVQSQWDYFRRVHHKTRRAFTKKLKG
jgi:GNAT superfamily N-acetyltransferase